jgi:pilus assembly protein CpaB
MNRLRMFVLAAVAFTLSIVVTVVAYKALRNRMQPPDDMGQIVVAAHELTLGERLTEADLKLSPWPRATPMKGSFLEMGEVLGRGVIVPMIPNEPILDSKLAPAGAGAGLTSAIPDGMRAVGVKVNDVIGVAGFVLPGSRVDVILSGSPDINGTQNDLMSKVILENIQVLSAGQNIARDSDGKAQNVQVVTLLVSPDESEKLALASTDGKIQLALRNPLDLKNPSPVAIRRASLFGNAAASAPLPAPVKPKAAAPKPVAAVQPPPPPPPAPVAPAAPVAVQASKVEMMLIQGSKSEKVSFDKKDDKKEKE